MKNLLIPVFVIICSMAFAQSNPITVTQKKYTLVFQSNDAGFDTVECRRLINTFFVVYPKLAKEYNKNTETTVHILIDTAYKGVAATDNAHVAINPEWLKKHPEDIDVVTHEVMHIVQNYGQTDAPGWLTEGIADYARYKFGINNPAANWKLPDYKASQSYTNAYRVTARFLAWLELHKKKGIVKELDKQMREHTYTDQSWQKLTGKTVDELWNEYSANPAL